MAHENVPIDQENYGFTGLDPHAPGQHDNYGGPFVQAAQETTDAHTGFQAVNRGVIAPEGHTIPTGLIGTEEVQKDTRAEASNAVIGADDDTVSKPSILESPEVPGAVDLGGSANENTGRFTQEKPLTETVSLGVHGSPGSVVGEGGTLGSSAPSAGPVPPVHGPEDAIW